MSEPRTRESAYADLVCALLAARSAPATERFDAEIAEAERAGRLDPATARTLRYWQRAAVAEVVEHAVAVLPPTLAAGDAADLEAQEAAAAAADSWDRAKPLLPAAAAGTPPDTITLPGAGRTADTAPPGAPRRRLLVAGLTVLPDTGDA